MDTDFCPCPDCSTVEARHAEGHPNEYAPELSCSLCREEIRLMQEQEE